jgi:hypothetical protein
LQRLRARREPQREQLQRVLESQAGWQRQRALQQAPWHALEFSRVAQRLSSEFVALDQAGAACFRGPLLYVLLQLLMVLLQEAVP